MKKYISIIFVLLFALSALGQTEKASLNSWRGLTLDSSTTSDAKRVLGEPDKLKDNERFTPLIYSKWFGNKAERKFLKLTFKKVEGFDGANLYFLDDNLKVIELDMKKDLPATGLVSAYENKFFPLVGNYAAGISPADLAEAKREVIYPPRFPLQYNMAAASEKAIGLAFASSGFGESMASAMINGSAGGSISSSLPGIVRTIQLISRTLENNKGTDLLK